MSAPPEKLSPTSRIRLRQVLQAMQITQAQLATKIGATGPHINRVICGHAPVTTLMAGALRGNLGDDFWQYITTTEAPVPQRLVELLQAAGGGAAPS